MNPGKTDFLTFLDPGDDTLARGVAYVRTDLLSEFRRFVNETPLTPQQQNGLYAAAAFYNRLFSVAALFHHGADLGTAIAFARRTAQDKDSSRKKRKAMAMAGKVLTDYKGSAFPYFKYNQADITAGIARRQARLAQQAATLKELQDAAALLLAAPRLEKPVCAPAPAKPEA